MIQAITQWINRLESHRWHDVVFDPVVIGVVGGFALFAIIWIILFIQEIRK